MKKFFLISLFTISIFSQGCNTVQGFGKDLQKGGEAIQKTAEKA